MIQSFPRLTFARSRPVSYDDMDSSLSLLYLIVVLRSTLFIRFHPEVTSTITTIRLILPMLLRIGVVFMSVMYAFVMIGCSMFENSLVKNDALTQSAYHAFHYDELNFASFWSTFVLLHQCLLGPNFPVFIEAVAEYLELSADNITIVSVRVSDARRRLDNQARISVGIRIKTRVTRALDMWLALDKLSEEGSSAELGLVDSMHRQDAELFPATMRLTATEMAPVYAPGEDPHAVKEHDAAGQGMVVIAAAGGVVVVVLLAVLLVVRNKRRKGAPDGGAEYSHGAKQQAQRGSAWEGSTRWREKGVPEEDIETERAKHRRPVHIRKFESSALREDGVPSNVIEKMRGLKDTV